MSETQESRKRNKKRYANFKNKRHRGPRELEVGMQGILITCNMNQRKCTAEAFSLLSEYADQLYGPEKFADSAESDSDDGADEDDAEAELKKEVKQIRSSMQKRERRFQALDSGANNVVFIRTQNLADPSKLVHHILEDLHKTKKMKSRVILRMLPVSGTCRAFIEDMEKYLSRFLEPWFRDPNQGTFQIVFKARNSSHMKREEVIKALAGLVGKMNRMNKVDLTNPQYTIIVEVIKSVCCVSVVQDYMLFRKFNLQEVVKLDKAEETRQTTGESQQKPVEEEAKAVKQEEVAQESEMGPELGEMKKEVEEEVAVATDMEKDEEEPVIQQ
ncbi:THUMP domain-containing protein 1-like [Arapaima gigas]